MPRWTRPPISVRSGSTFPRPTRTSTSTGWPTSSQAGNGGRNFAFYSNPRVDELLDIAVSEMDSKSRCELYGEAMQILQEDMPFTPVVTMVALSAQRDYVRGYVPTKAHPLTQNIYGMWLE